MRSSYELIGQLKTRHNKLIHCKSNKTRTTMLTIIYKQIKGINAVNTHFDIVLVSKFSTWTVGCI